MENAPDLPPGRSRVCVHSGVATFEFLGDVEVGLPDWAQADDDLIERCFAVLEVLENHQKWMRQHFGLIEDPFEIITPNPVYLTGDVKPDSLERFMAQFVPVGTPKD